MNKWVADYEHENPGKLVNYRPIGSGAGIDELRKGYLSFAVSDAPLTCDQLTEMARVIQVPASAGPVCVIYNLPKLKAPLRLSAKSLAAIYL